ncbi:MAG: hypothetical protein GXY42_10400 [Desulfovibrionales bacterium]|nr:hypothetical protein [Desulfovibrionales bacterium]
MIGGGFEFAGVAGASNRPPAEIAKAARAYAMLPYDAVLLAPADLQVLKEGNVPSSPAWKNPGPAPEVLERDVPEGKLAFILFPQESDKEEETSALAEKLRQSGKFNLIVGVSTWGSARETAFINSKGSVFDIILGSGEGPGYTGLYMADNQVLWVRPFGKGMGVNSVIIPAMPRPGKKIVWEPESTVLTRNTPLNDAVTADPQIRAALNP